LPSGEKTGAVSHAGLSAVRLRGGAEPSAGTAHKSRFVDHASSRPPRRAVNTTDFPSRLNATSSGPPKGLLGASASMSFIRSAGSPPAVAIANRWERRPSSQVSQ
jgi:hypothetical protein